MSDLLELGRDILKRQSFSTHVGAELAVFEAGRAELVLDVGDHLLQQNGFVHGGVVAYLVDNAITFAGGSVLGPNVLTQEYKVSFVRPAVGARLIARAAVVHHSRRQAVCRCDVYATGADEEEKLCATALGTILGAGTPADESPS
ncbi:MAG: PaaI family thioesterase [Actinomycetota bacterium]